MNSWKVLGSHGSIRACRPNFPQQLRRENSLARQSTICPARSVKFHIQRMPFQLKAATLLKRPTGNQLADFHQAMANQPGLVIRHTPKVAYLSLRKRLQQLRGQVAGSLDELRLSLLNLCLSVGSGSESNCENRFYPKHRPRILKPTKSIADRER